MKKKIIPALLALAMVLSTAQLGTVTAFAASVGATFTADSNGTTIQYQVLDASTV